MQSTRNGTTENRKLVALIIRRVRSTYMTGQKDLFTRIAFLLKKWLYCRNFGKYKKRIRSSHWVSKDNRDIITEYGVNRENKAFHKISKPGYIYSGALTLSSCLSTAQPRSSTVPPILFGGQYRNTDLPMIFLAGRGPLNKTELIKVNQERRKYSDLKVQIKVATLSTC